MTILVVRLAAMGDVLRTLPAVRLVRRGLDRARIHWVVDDRWRMLLEGHPDLDGLVSFPRREWQRRSGALFGWPAAARSFRQFRASVRSLEPTLVMDFHGNLRSGLTGRLSGAPVRLGYTGHQQKELNRWLNTHHRPSDARRTPRMERNLDLVRALGLPDHPLPTGNLPLAAEGRDVARRVLASMPEPGRPFAVISPGASLSQAYKKLPVALAAAATRRLSAAGVAPLVVWGPGEEEDATALVASPDSGATLAPPTDLATLAALLEETRLFVGGDSGPLHMACASGCPVVGIYGPTDPVVNRPWAVPFRTVYPAPREYTGIKRLDREAGGFSGITPDQVESAVTELLAETGSRGAEGPIAGDA